MDRQPVFCAAEEKDAACITQLRRRVWDATYRGIYPDAAIDEYDYPYHLARDLARIRDASYRVYLIRDSEEPVGYFSFQHAGGVHVQSLYLLPEYQRRGLGRAAFALVRDYCAAQGLSSFTCNCNAHNHRAQGFYERLGGRVIRTDCGHANRQEDQLTYQFSV